MTQKDLAHNYTASQILLADYRQAHALAVTAYKEAAMKVTTPYAEAARLRVAMQRAGQLVLAAEKLAAPLHTQIVEQATPQVLAAAHEYRKRLSYSEPRKPVKWPPGEYHLVSDFVMPVAATAGCYYIGGPYLAGAFAVVAALVTTVRVLLRQRKESRWRYELSEHNAAVNAKWLQEAADRLNTLVGTSYAADTLSVALDQKYGQKELLLADGTVLHNDAERRRAAARQEGLDAWCEHQTSGAIAATVAAGGAVAYADDVEPAGMSVMLEPPPALEYYDMSTLEPLSVFPEVNTNGVPMLPGDCGVDAHGEVFGAPTWP